jgi:coenzyme PQQ precursor peptide PqqA
MASGPVYDDCTSGRGVSAMAWETPAFVEIKMDAEINAYQEDLSGI